MPRASSATALLSVLTILLLLTGCDEQPEGPAVRPIAEAVAPTVDVVVPAGTGRQLDRGQRVSVWPASLTLHVGDTLRVRNDDDRGHVVGPFFVRAGETVTQQFASPGRFSGACALHPDGRFELVVER